MTGSFIMYNFVDEKNSYQYKPDFDQIKFLLDNHNVVFLIA